MVESEAQELSEEVMLGAVVFGHEQMQAAINAINDLVEEAGKPEWDWQAPAKDEALAARLSERLDIGPRRWRLQTFERCLVGEEAVSWMARHLTLARTDAVAVGQALGRLGLLVHVAHAHPFLDDHLFSRIAWSRRADALALDETFDALRGADGVPVRDRTHLGETYASCWIGSEAVDWLTARYGIDRVDAWVVLHRLMQFGLVEHVARARPFIDGPFFYRFGGWPSG
jgi:hypothetical protein